jgi:predicted component of type VI protein secretion system
MNKKTFITTLLTLLILLLSSGCNSVPKQDQPNKDVVFVKDINLLSKSETVDTSADNIDTLTPNIPAVKTETAKLKVVAKELVEDDKAVK